VAARWTRLFICVSRREAADGTFAGVGGDRRVVLNAVDCEHFSVADDADRREARARLALPDGPLAVCIGRLGRQKGQDLLVSIWPRVRAAVPDAVLALVGGGAARSELAVAAGEGVFLFGERAEVRDWLAAADVVVVPSRWEGMSYAMLEAMSRGRCVVASDVGGAREAIGAEAGRAAGTLVPPADVTALADAVIDRLMDADLAAAEGAEGARRARDRHDIRRWWDAMDAVVLEASGVATLRSSA
jgi:glycosyltransferase involved in cell wall biosynthesis